MWQIPHNIPQSTFSDIVITLAKTNTKNNEKDIEFVVQDYPKSL